MMKCKEVTHLLSEAQDRKLVVGERIQVAMHLLMCEGCTNFRKQIDFLRLASRRYAAGPGDDEGSASPRR